MQQKSRPGSTASARISRQPAAGGTIAPVQQVWFAGVHSDVGGGYTEAEAGLSRIPLAGMVCEAQAAGCAQGGLLCRTSHCCTTACVYA